MNMYMVYWMPVLAHRKEERIIWYWESWTHKISCISEVENFSVFQKMKICEDFDPGLKLLYVDIVLSTLDQRLEPEFVSTYGIN